MRIFTFLVALLIGSLSQAAHISSLFYDYNSKILKIDFLYTGGNLEHNFSLLWDPCKQEGSNYGVAARLIDTGWEDTGSLEYQDSLEVDLNFITCKPVELTIFGDGKQHLSIFIE